MFKVIFTLQISLGVVVVANIIVAGLVFFVLMHFFSPSPLYIMRFRTHVHTVYFTSYPYF